MRRLRWVVLPAGCVLGNSVNHLELPGEVADRLSDQRGNLKSALSWLCDLLNDKRLDACASLGGEQQREQLRIGNAASTSIRKCTFTPICLDSDIRSLPSGLR